MLIRRPGSNKIDYFSTGDPKIDRPPLQGSVQKGAQGDDLLPNGK